MQKDKSQDQKKMLDHLYQIVKLLSQNILNQKSHDQTKLNILECFKEVQKLLNQLFQNEQLHGEHNQNLQCIHDNILNNIQSIMRIFKQSLYNGSYLCSFIRSQMQRQVKIKKIELKQKQNLKQQQIQEYYPNLMANFEYKVTNLHYILNKYIKLIIFIVLGKDNNDDPQFLDCLSLKEYYKPFQQVTLMSQKDNQFLHDPILKSILQYLKQKDTKSIWYKTLYQLNKKIRIKNQQIQKQICEKQERKKQYQNNESYSSEQDQKQIYFLGLFMLKRIKSSQSKSPEQAEKNQMVKQVWKIVWKQFINNWLNSQQSQVQKESEIQIDRFHSAYLENNK